MKQSVGSGSQLPMFHIVGFSGHRQLGESQGVADAIGDALQFIRREAPGEWVALSSVAEGSDQLFVTQALSRGLAWHAILPLPHDEFAKDFQPPEWAQVEGLLARAEHAQVSSDSGAREEAYLDCGMETVNGADVLLAVWDGEPARGKGGTAEVIAYARSIGRPIIIIDPVTAARRVENWSSFDVREAGLANLNQLPDATVAWSENPFKAPDVIFSFQQKCDYAASRSAPGIRRLTVSTVLLHVVATLLAAAALAFSLHLAVLAWVKLLCLAAGVAAAFVLRHSLHSQRSWVKCRLAAEFCRSALATWGLPRATNLLQDLELPAVRQLARSLRIMHSRSAAERPVPMEDFQRIYREKRIEDQLAYYRRQEHRALPLLRRLRQTFWLATGLALACVAAYAVALTLHVEVLPWVQYTFLDFLPITLPVAAASTISVISINDLRRRVARYRDMQMTLEASRAQIDYCGTWGSLERLVLRTERALLQEVIEWHSLASFSESH